MPKNKNVPKDSVRTKIDAYKAEMNRDSDEANKLKKAVERGQKKAAEEERNRKFADRRNRMESAAEGKGLTEVDRNLAKEARRTTKKALDAEKGFTELASTSKERHNKAASDRIGKFVNELQAERDLKSKDRGDSGGVGRR